MSGIGTDRAGWYPFVRLDVDPASLPLSGHESRQEPLLDAVQKLLTDEQVDRQDFCRYSICIP